VCGHGRAGCVRKPRTGLKPQTSTHRVKAGLSQGPGHRPILLTSKDITTGALIGAYSASVNSLDTRTGEPGAACARGGDPPLGRACAGACRLIAACLSAQAAPGVPPPPQIPNSSQPNLPSLSHNLCMCACASGRLSNCVPPPTACSPISIVYAAPTSTRWPRVMCALLQSSRVHASTS
jgi:hypothetical protein